MTLDLSKHPCFNDAVRHQFGRIHLPVAPACNIQCNFCDRRFNCVNESRPGVTASVLSPHQALSYLQQAVERDPRIAVVGIAGPGDPMANVEATMTTLRLTREHYPEMLLCVATNGLNLAPQADELAQLNVSHVTLTVNAVRPEIGQHIYAWVRDGRQVHRGVHGAALLWERQREAIRQLKALDVVVKINTILIPGVNDQHIEAIAQTMRDLGADLLNCIPMYPVENTPLGQLPEPSPQQVVDARLQAGQYLPLMHHCTRCRADASGLLGEALSDQQQTALQQAAAQPLVPTQTRPCVAVATLEGMLVNQHLGEAHRLAVYRQQDDDFELVETRRTPVAGGGSERWQQLADMLHDCRALLVSSAGAAPVEVLRRAGIRVVMMEGLIEEGLEAVFAGSELRAPLRRDHRCGAGASCAGDGMGCM
ncbi:MAG: radical SAM protein [Planctomycetaceae bacterium]|nr:MAG: radical SAM protein [Planctomycetaceae bacterium]